MSDMKVLVGIKGGGSIYGESGKLIQKELEQITAQLTGSKAPRIQIAVDLGRTKPAFAKQLQDMVKSVDLSTAVHATVTAQVRAFQSEAPVSQGSRSGESTRVVACAHGDYAQQRKAAVRFSLRYFGDDQG